MRERREAFRDARLIVIASEGKDTERIFPSACVHTHFIFLTLNANFHKLSVN